MNPEWQTISEEVVKGARILIKRGCEAFGHLSARLPGSDRFIITPSLSMAMVRSTEDLVQVNLKGEKVEGKNRQPYETWLHTGLYRARSDVGGIARTHSFTTSAFSVAGESIKPVHDFGAMMLGETPVFQDPRLIVNEEMGLGLPSLSEKERALCFAETARPSWERMRWRLSSEPSIWRNQRCFN